jgi:hypothetical protein
MSTSAVSLEGEDVVVDLLDSLCDRGAAARTDGCGPSRNCRSNAGDSARTGRVSYAQNVTLGKPDCRDPRVLDLMSIATTLVFCLGTAESCHRRKQEARTMPQYTLWPSKLWGPATSRDALPIE